MSRRKIIVKQSESEERKEQEYLLGSIKALKMEIIEGEEKLKDLEQAIKDIAPEKEEVSCELTEKRNELLELKEEIKNSFNSLSSTIEREVALSKDITKEQIKLNEIKDEYSKEKIRNEQKIKDNKEKLRNQTKQIADNDFVLEKLENSKSQLDRKKSQVIDRLEDDGLKLRKIQDEYNYLRNKKVKISSDLELLKIKLDSQNKKASGIKENEEISLLKKEISSLEKDLSILRANKKELKEDCEEFVNKKAKVAMVINERIRVLERMKEDKDLSDEIDSLV